MLRRSLTAVLIVCSLVGVLQAQPPYPLGPKPGTPEPPLADGTSSPMEPNQIEPAVYNQSTPLTSAANPVDLATPYLTIQVVASETAAVGADLTFTLVVKNPSQARAHHVLVRCMVPKNAAFVKADLEPTALQPEPQWQLNTLEPGANKRIEVTLKPNPGEEEVKVVGRVQFDHGQVVKTRIARPTLSVKKLGPTEGVLYDNLSYRIEVANTGKVAVPDVKVVDKLPEGFDYEQDKAANSTIDPAKNQRTWTVGTLRPGERKTLEYRVIAKTTGKDLASMTQVSGGGISDEAPFKVTIREAKLAVQLDGPELGQAFVNQPAAYQVAVKNNGTATLNNVRVTCTFPTDCRLARASNGASFFKDSVQWILPKLAPGEGRNLTFHLIAPNAGKRKVTAGVRGDRGLEQSAEIMTDFQGIAALHWETEGTPVASVGKEIKYTIKVTNTGSADAGNVRVSAFLPPHVDFKDEANPPFSLQGATVAFKPIQLPARRSATYTISFSAKHKGEARFRFELLSDQMRSGVAVHEKSTTINGDPNVPAAEPKKDPKSNGPIA